MGGLMTSYILSIDTNGQEENYFTPTHPVETLV